MALVALTHYMIGYDKNGILFKENHIKRQDLFSY